MFLALFTSMMLYAEKKAPSFYICVSSTVSVTGTSTKFLDNDKEREYVFIQNIGASAIYVKFNSAHTGSEGITLAQNERYEPSVIPMGEVWMKSSAGAMNVNVTSCK
jgi:hypothetical protein